MEVIASELLKIVALLYEIGNWPFIVVTIVMSWVLRRIANGNFDHQRDTDLLIPLSLSVVVGTLIELTTPKFSPQFAIMRAMFNAGITSMFFKPAAFTGYLPAPLLDAIPDSLRLPIPLLNISIPLKGLREWALREAQKRSFYTTI